MATSSSSYWVKFFTAAGFPLDVATKHAVVFSNNRIKPDMLPDLDKPSLKEMGITLMGDMIAILRYAKKVTEEMTCERFLVDTVEAKKPTIKSLSSTNAAKIGQKKLATKISTIGKLSDVKDMKSVAVKNSFKTSKALSAAASNLGVKKKVMSAPITRVITPAKKVTESVAKKRKIVQVVVDSDDEESDDDDNDDNDNQIQVAKRLKPSSDNNKISYKVIVNKTSGLRSQEQSKKANDAQKRTVFDRLGDSAVTSTTNNNDNNNTTFNVTGIGSEVVKRNYSVFNRLGDRDAKKDINNSVSLKNGNSLQLTTSPQSILKSKPTSGFGSSTIIKVGGFRSIIKDNKLSTAPTKIKTGTMHADHEGNKKVSTSVKQLVRTTKAMKLNNAVNIERKIPTNKLASERVSSLPAKARLGINALRQKQMQQQQKQVTFNKIATVAHIKKPGVFSRLGI